MLALIGRSTSGGSRVSPCDGIRNALAGVIGAESVVGFDLGGFRGEFIILDGNQVE
jgi:hypothetical protein